MRDVRHSFMLRVMFSVLQFRINQRYVSDGASFLSIDSETADSGREGCAVTLLTVQAEPKDWDSAVRVSSESATHKNKPTWHVVLGHHPFLCWAAICLGVVSCCAARLSCSAARSHLMLGHPYCNFDVKSWVLLRLGRLCLAHAAVLPCCL